MRALINYFKQHVNRARQDSLLLVTTIYGKNARDLWLTLGYGSMCEFDKSLSQARMKKANRHKKIQPD